MSLHARTNFLKYAAYIFSFCLVAYVCAKSKSIHMPAFAVHKNIAYRFLPPSKVSAVIDISITSEPCCFTRLFLIFRGLSDDNVASFSNAGQKEAYSVDWRQVIGWSEHSKDKTMFRILETSVFEVG